MMNQLCILPFFSAYLFRVVLSSYILKEKLGFLGKVGCLLCILGATMVVLHAPREGNVKSMVELGEKMQGYGKYADLAYSL